MLATYMAAVCHDYAHKGVNNDFLIKTQDDLAIQYNDRSPMENYHAAATWMKLKAEQHNFLKKLPAKALEYLRKLVIDMILSTDMKQVGVRSERMRFGRRSHLKQMGVLVNMKSIENLG